MRSDNTQQQQTITHTDMLHKIRQTFLKGLAVVLTIITAPVGMLALLMATIIDILQEIAEE